MNNEKEQAERIMSLMAQCKNVLAFEHEVVIYRAYAPEVVKKFIKANPEKADFHVWLQDNYGSKVLTTRISE